MNFYKRMSVLMVCVAAITLSGCSAIKSEKPSVVTSTPSKPAPIPQDEELKPDAPLQYDEFVNWTNGEKLSEMEPVGEMLGLDIYTPYSTYVDQGFVGVAPLETSCIVAFAAVPDTSETSRLSATVMSRFDISVTDIIAGADMAQLKAFVDSYRTTCADAPPVISA